MSVVLNLVDGQSTVNMPSGVGLDDPIVVLDGALLTPISDYLYTSTSITLESPAEGDASVLVVDNECDFFESAVPVCGMSAGCDPIPS